MAAQMPECQFTGIDFSGPDIASAQEMAREAGLTNVELQQADLMNWDPRGAKFDFIIAYGFFSWVPDEVKDRLLQLIAGCLAPQGIACVSYMTYPGCKQPEALRDLLKLHTDSLQDPLEKVAAEYPGQRVAVVTHNGVIKLAAQIVTGAPTEAVFHIDAAPCSITSISIWPSDGLRALRSLNETGHFRP